jgi:hypothetical protein
MSDVASVQIELIEISAVPQLLIIPHGDSDLQSDCFSQLYHSINACTIFFFVACLRELTFRNRRMDFIVVPGIWQLIILE